MDRIPAAKKELDKLYDMLVEAQRINDPVVQRKKVQEIVAQMRRLADYLDPDAEQ